MLCNVRAPRAVTGVRAGQRCAVAKGYTQLKPRSCRRPARPAAQQQSGELGDEDLEAQLEDFMRRQAELEGGKASRNVEPGKVVGTEEVSEEDSKRMCRAIVAALKLLKEQRDMTANEVRLTVAIEDPRARERRLMGMEDSSGVSRDEMAAALVEVSQGRVPADRIALRELHREVTAWPFLAAEQDKKQQSTSGGGSEAAESSAAAEVEAPAGAWQPPPKPRPPVGRDPTEEPQGLADMLPDWVGYGALYAVSSLPVIIVVSVIAILFVNSLR